LDLFSASVDKDMLKATRNPGLLTEEEKAEAIRLTLAGLGKAELEIGGSYASPLVWTVEIDDGPKRMKGGTVFFLDTGEATFAARAGHVVQEFFDDTKVQRVHCAIAAHGKQPLRIPLGDRMIDANAEIDIATFRVSPDEMQYFGKTALRGHVRDWPPRLAEANGPATYC
jgi:hypothetical protein